MRLVKSADIRWVKTVLMHRLELTRLTLAEDMEHQADYPDIWVDGSTATITVTRAWARKSTRQRRVELLHECLHLKGFRHGPRERAMGYYSKPERDVYTQRLYDAWFGGRS